MAFPGLRGVLPGYGRFDPCDWGLGFEVKGDKTPHWSGTRTSPETFGHFGKAGGFLWVDPVAGLACASLSNREFGPWAVTEWSILADAVVEEWTTGPVKTLRTTVRSIGQPSRTDETAPESADVELLPPLEHADVRAEAEFEEREAAEAELLLAEAERLDQEVAEARAAAEAERLEREADEARAAAETERLEREADEARAAAEGERRARQAAEAKAAAEAEEIRREVAEARALAEAERREREAAEVERHEHEIAAQAAAEAETVRLQEAQAEVELLMAETAAAGTRSGRGPGHGRRRTARSPGGRSEGGGGRRGDSPGSGRGPGHGRSRTAGAPGDRGRAARTRDRHAGGGRSREGPSSRKLRPRSSC